MNSNKTEPQLIQSTVLIVALDINKTCNQINKVWPEIKCLSFNAPSFFDKPIHSVVRQIYFYTFRAYLLAALAEVSIKFIYFFN